MEQFNVASERFFLEGWLITKYFDSLPLPSKTGNQIKTIDF